MTKEELQKEVYESLFEKSNFLFKNLWHDTENHVFIYFFFYCPIAGFGRRANKRFSIRFRALMS